MSFGLSVCASLAFVSLTKRTRNNRYQLYPLNNLLLARNEDEEGEALKEPEIAVLPRNVIFRHNSANAEPGLGRGKSLTLNKTAMIML